MQKFSSAIPVSLYIHLPWCVQKCPYCDFNSHALRDSLPEEHYIDVLLQDLQTQLAKLAGRSLVSIFFGGGTPSLFSPQGIERILTCVDKLVGIANDLEITLEANPGTLDESRFIDFRQAGINRISLGVQSFHDDKLKILGRIHGRAQAKRAITNLQRAGFTNFNIDLMHGLPQQTQADALADLQDALAYAPTHISWYQLTIEPNTLFHHQPPALPDETVLWDIQEAGYELLQQAGYQQYEVSAYARDKHYCQHNLNYWQFGDYLGIGAGAHSKLTCVDQQCITRHWQKKNPRAYLLAKHALTEQEVIISEKDVLFECMMNVLRLHEGVPLTLVAERTGLSANTITMALKPGRAKQWLIDNPHHLKTTELGQRFLNDVVALFLPTNS